jgi:hypothetical protein
MSSAVHALGFQTPVSTIRRFVIAGWTGRDPETVQKHIDELRAIGVTPPGSVPVFYEVGSTLITTSPEISVVGDNTSGEVEFVLISTPRGLLVTVGSDHTDRGLETVSVHHSKQVCPKPVADAVWSFESLEGHWDRLLLRAYSERGATRRLYQEGLVTSMLSPQDLLDRYVRVHGEFAFGTAMFCGTLPLTAEIEHGDHFEIQLEDPVTQRTLRHRYRIHSIPVAG